MAIVVSDTEPLLALAQAGVLSVLHELFGTVHLPTAVWHECQIKQGTDSQQIQQAQAAGWLVVTSVTRRHAFPMSLGDGKAEAMQLALDTASTLLILDDQLARREAMRLGLNFIGTVKVLSLAEQRGLIASAKRIIEEMRSNGYRISADFLKHC